MHALEYLETGYQTARGRLLSRTGFDFDSVRDDLRASVFSDFRPLPGASKSELMGKFREDYADSFMAAIVSRLAQGILPAYKGLADDLTEISLYLYFEFLLEAFPQK